MFSKSTDTFFTGMLLGLLGKEVFKLQLLIIYHSFIKK